MAESELLESGLQARRAAKIAGRSSTGGGLSTLLAVTAFMPRLGECGCMGWLYFLGPARLFSGVQRQAGHVPAARGRLRGAWPGRARPGRVAAARR